MILIKKLSIHEFFILLKQVTIDIESLTKKVNKIFKKTEKIFKAPGFPGWVAGPVSWSGWPYQLARQCVREGKER